MEGSSQQKQEELILLSFGTLLERSERLANGMDCLNYEQIEELNQLRNAAFYNLRNYMIYYEDSYEQSDAFYHSERFQSIEKKYNRLTQILEAGFRGLKERLSNELVRARSQKNMINRYKSQSLVPTANFVAKGI